MITMTIIMRNIIMMTIMILTTQYLSCIHPDFMGGKKSEGLIAIARVSLDNFMTCICICVFVFMQADYLHAAHTADG